MKLQTPEERVGATLEENAVLKAIVEAEPDIRHVLHVAAMQKEPRTRWRAYSALKQVCESLVGWDARNTALRTERHYETVIDAIDALLIAAEVDEDEPPAA